MEFQRVEYGQELRIAFTALPEGTDYVGLFCANGCSDGNFSGVIDDEIGGGGPQILIDTGTEYCPRGNEYSVLSMANTVAHEIGHLFGLEHHTDYNHLMYGHDGGSYDVSSDGAFDNLGLNIPNRFLILGGCS